MIYKLTWSSEVNQDDVGDLSGHGCRLLLHQLLDCLLGWASSLLHVLVQELESEGLQGPVVQEKPKYKVHHLVWVYT